MPIYVGIDWSENKHDVVFLNDARASLAQMMTPHSVDGLIKLDTISQALGVSPSEVLIGLETAHNLLIDFLWLILLLKVWLKSIMCFLGGRVLRSLA